VAASPSGLGILFTHFNPVTKQYKLVPVSGWWVAEAEVKAEVIIMRPKFSLKPDWIGKLSSDKQQLQVNWC